MRAIGTSLLLALATLPAPGIAQAPGQPASIAGLIHAHVILTPRAAKRLSALKEDVLVRATYSGDPTPKTPRAWITLEGDVDLGSREGRVPPNGGFVQLAPPPRVQQAAAMVARGKVLVSISVTSGRKTSKDNLIYCPTVTGDLATMNRDPGVRCDLIQ